jgi:hypothetical protein
VLLRPKAPGVSLSPSSISRTSTWRLDPHLLVALVLDRLSLDLDLDTPTPVAELDGVRLVPLPVARLLDGAMRPQVLEANLQDGVYPSLRQHREETLGALVVYQHRTKARGNRKLHVQAGVQVPVVLETGNRQSRYQPDGKMFRALSRPRILASGDNPIPSKMPGWILGQSTTGSEAVMTLPASVVAEPNGMGTLLRTTSARHLTGPTRILTVEQRRAVGTPHMMIVLI